MKRKILSVSLILMFLAMAIPANGGYWTWQNQLTYYFDSDDASNFTSGDGGLGCDSTEAIGESDSSNPRAATFKAYANGVYCWARADGAFSNRYDPYTNIQSGKYRVIYEIPDIQGFYDSTGDGSEHLNMIFRFYEVDAYDATTLLHQFAFRGDENTGDSTFTGGMILTTPERDPSQYAVGLVAYILIDLGCDGSWGEREADCHLEVDFYRFKLERKVYVTGGGPY